MGYVLHVFDIFNGINRFLIVYPFLVKSVSLSPQLRAAIGLILEYQCPRSPERNQDNPSPRTIIYRLFTSKDVRSPCTPSPRSSVAEAQT
jgi:hypothetical protein